jgi:hypothetical protein
MAGKATGLAVLVLLGLVAGAATAGAQQPPARADLVVDTGDGRVLVRSAEFGGPFTGMDLLQAAGVDLELAGGAVCSVDAVGCPGTNCFCQCATGDACRYWHYFHMDPSGSWATAGEGAAEAILASGSVDGWAWSDARAPITATQAVRSGLLGMGWLMRQQMPDGSVGGHAGLTSEFVLAAAAVGVPAADLKTGEGAGSGDAASAMGYLARVAANYSGTSAAAAGKLAAAVSAGGGDPRSFGGLDLESRIHDWYDSGTFGSSVWDQSWSILGLAAAGETVCRPGEAACIPAAAVDALATMGPPEGGWGGAAGSPPDPDSTGLALQALARAGRDGSDLSVARGVAYLRASRNDQGGWGHEGGATNANSTAYAIQGLLAAGEDLAAPAWETAGGVGPLEALTALQRGDGRFEHDASPADLVATLQAVPAVAGRSAGYDGAGVASRRALARVLADRIPEGGFAGFPPGATVDAVLALAAHGEEPDVPAPGGATPSEYLAAEAPEYAATGPAAAGKLALAAAALDEDARSFGGVDLVATIESAYDPVSGAYGTGGTWAQAYALLGLVAAGREVPPAAAAHLAAIASPGGGWGYEAVAPVPDPDSTGVALQAAIAAGMGPDDPVVRRAVEALHALQLDDSSFPGYDGASSTVSAATAVSGLVAADQVVDGAGWRRDWQQMRRGPLDALLGAQTDSGGFVGYGGVEDPAATYAAALALSGRALPVPAPVFSPSRAFLPVLVYR